ncbi:MAG: DNA repair protein RecO [Bacteroidales bacterium]|nr:DNA repair protein RecO [Bacteroidales bacterium]
MSLIATKGIVLTHFKYSETSIIVQILTQDRGKMSFIANGVRKKKPSFPYGYFQAFSILEIIFFDSKTSDLYRIKEVTPLRLNSNIQIQLYKSNIALFLAEIIHQTHANHHQEYDLYEFLFRFIPYLDECSNEKLNNVHLWALIKLIYFLGIYPNINYSLETPIFNPVEACFVNSSQMKQSYFNMEQSKLLYQISKKSVEDVPSIILTRDQRQTFIQLILDYMNIHLEGFKPGKSLSILQEIFD